ncbi:MAG TPA: peptidase [Candidatus Pullilachnospira intestinigallinarum]|nr:peptidase [Candidatus Pullilachnospira intestinigallinarum]
MKRRLKKFLKKIAIQRTTALILVFVLLAVILLQRLFSLQVIHGQEYADNFSLQTTRTRTLKSTRGNIYDRNGNVLASNELSYSVTLEDNGTYSTTRERNLSLNGEIYRILQIVEENGDSLSSGFHVVLDDSGSYAYDVEGVSLQRFRADVYGHSLIDDLKSEEADATAEEMMEDLADRFGLTDPKDKPYSEEELLEVGLPQELTKEEILKIVTVRYAMSIVSFQRYMPVTIASDVSEETASAILENQPTLQGVDVAEDSIRVYTDAEYFSNLLGYTGQISSEELTKLQEENPDAGYSTTSIVGKSGLEQVMEPTLQGQDGSEKVYVDNLGKVLEVDEESRQEPVQGNDVYLTIDKDLQIACYRILEQRIAGIIVSNLSNIKTFEASEDVQASAIPIPIYDVYNALISNSVIDISHFLADDASATEQKVQQAFERKQQEVFQWITDDLTGTDPEPYSQLDEEMQEYESYIVNDLLMDKTGILSESAIDKNDDVYKAWTSEESISLQEYLTYAASQNWIDISQISSQETYLDSQQVYQELAAYIVDYLSTDTDFSKLLYHYMLLDDEISGRDLCIILYEQGILSTDDGVYESFLEGEVTPFDLLSQKIDSLEITPAQLALNPCSGSIVIVDPNTGETLACVSYPGYDNNRLANNMDTAYYRKLNSDLSSPFYNKATQQRTAPGSTFKPITAVAGLMEGVINDNTVINCNGLFDKIPGSPLQCWQTSGHGNLTIREGIANSCNVFFSETAYRLGQNEDGVFSDSTALQKLTAYAQLFNMDKESGLEISESTPQISDSMPIPSAIGQGTHNYTTSQLARYVASLANSGTSYNISLLDRVTDASGNLIQDYTPEVLSTIDLPQWIWDDLHAGMEGVITETNSYIFGDLDVTLAGKTGTAEITAGQANHALFVGYAPSDTPEIALAVRIANGYSSQNAAWVARDVLNYYFELEDESEILSGEAQTNGMTTNNVRTD